MPVIFPTSWSEFGIEAFFQPLHQRYDERIVYSAPEIIRLTERPILSSVPDITGLHASAELGRRARLDRVACRRKFY